VFHKYYKVRPFQHITRYKMGIKTSQKIRLSKPRLFFNPATQPTWSSTSPGS